MSKFVQLLLWAPEPLSRMIKILCRRCGVGRTLTEDFGCKNFNFGTTSHKFGPYTLKRALELC